VRVFKGKKQFEKEGENFSREVYKVVGVDKNKYIVEDEKGERFKRKLKPSEMIITTAPKLKTGDKVDKAVKESITGRKNKREGIDEDNIITRGRAHARRSQGVMGDENPSKKRRPNLRITIIGKRKVNEEVDEETIADRVLKRRTLKVKK
jgi:hypothetical protein